MVSIEVVWRGEVNQRFIHVPEICKHLSAATRDQQEGYYGNEYVGRDVGRNDYQSLGANTTIGIIATDAALTKAECKRLAVAAHDGFARALWPAHTPLDGDLIFAISTGAVTEPLSIGQQMEMSAIAASTMSRAIARGVYAAKAMDGELFPSWAKAFGRD